MINFIKNYYKINSDYWYPSYLLDMLNKDKKIITTIKEDTFSVTMIHILVSFYLCFSQRDIKILFVSDYPNKIKYFINLFLRNFDSNSFSLNEDTCVITFFNNSRIEIIDIDVITNGNIVSDYVFVDVSKFKTKTSEYVVFNNLCSEIKDFVIICSIKDYNETTFFENAINEKESIKIPIIEF